MGKELKPLFNGQVFGRLTIVGRDNETSEARKKPYYFVMCSCGSPVKSVLKSTLFDKRHPLQSCGCLQKEKVGFVNDREIALKKLLYGKMKSRHIKALKCSEDSLISFEDFCLKIDKPCHYCGESKTSYYLDRRSSYIIYYNGLDRIDSSLGYTNENTVSACKWCNIAKNELSDDEFRTFIERIYDYQRKINK